MNFHTHEHHTLKKCHIILIYHEKLPTIEIFNQKNNRHTKKESLPLGLE